jgi:hypothetical protein
MGASLRVCNENQASIQKTPTSVSKALSSHIHAAMMIIKALATDDPFDQSRIVCGIFLNLIYESKLGGVHIASPRKA